MSTASSDKNKSADIGLESDGKNSDTNDGDVQQEQSRSSRNNVGDWDENQGGTDSNGGDDDAADNHEGVELVKAVICGEIQSSASADGNENGVLDQNTCVQNQQAAPSVENAIPQETGLQRATTSRSGATPQPKPGAYRVVGRVELVEESSEEEYDEDRPEGSPQQRLPQPDEEVPLDRHDSEEPALEHPSIVVAGENVETDVRERIMREAVVADVIEQKPQKCGGRHLVVVGTAVAVVLLVVVLIITLSIYFARSDQDQPSPAPSAPSLTSTLERVKQNGFVRCGVYTAAPGFILASEAGRYEGLSADLCRAVSAIVFDGDTERVEFVNTTAVERYANLGSGAIDVVSQTVTHTMERDVVELSTGFGFNFATPFYYSGTAFGGIPDFVDCAERLDSFYGICRDLRVCVGTGTTQEAILLELLPGPAILPLATPQAMFFGFLNGDCQIFAADMVNIPEIRIRATGYLGPYKLGTRLFSRDPLCLLTAENDLEWASLVDLTMHILITAEADNITKVTAESWGKQQLGSGSLDKTLIRRVVDVVGGVGNFGELYELHMEPVVPRNGVNLVHTDSSRNSSGLLYSFPFGNLQTTRTVDLADTTFESVLGAGQIRCAIVSNATEQDALSHFHQEFCKALAVALFLDVDSAVIVSVTDEPNAFDALANGEADVFLGAHFTLESLSGGFYTFSTPTYFEEDRGALALATLNSDPTWSDFVNWIVVAIVKAEEEGITQTNSLLMPVVNLYGQDLKQMLRDCIAAVGNYGDIFNRTLVRRGIPRSGRNRLNAGLDAPQHFPVPFQ